MKFGPSNLFSTTPDQAKKWFNVFFKITAVIILVLQFFPQIPKHIADPATIYIAESQGFAFAVSRMFGIQTEKPDVNGAKM
jgi:hypothetical protein